jgi:hypothetical protein
LEEKKEREKKEIIDDYEDKIIKISKKFDSDLDNIKIDYERKLK